MGFFEKVGETLSSTGNKVAQKTKDITGTVKMNSQISTEQDTITSLKLRIADIYIGKFGSSADADIEPLIEQINISKAKIAEITQQIQAQKGVKRCGSCGSEIEASVQFCPTCGSKVE